MKIVRGWSTAVQNDSNSHKNYYQVVSRQNHELCQSNRSSIQAGRCISQKVTSLPNHGKGPLNPTLFTVWLLLLLTWHRLCWLGYIPWLGQNVHQINCCAAFRWQLSTFFDVFKCNSYSLHMLKIFKEYRTIVTCMPTHTTKMLQQLHFSVFSRLKSFISNEFNKLTRIKKNIDAFDVSNML